MSCSGFDSGREAEALLVAEFAGGRTILRRQHVGYPLHVTRAFYLDRPRPDLATLYLQSASGGLYAGDRLKLNLTVGTDAALNLTTQAATVVHHGRESGAQQHQAIKVMSGAFCALISDPYVLFPGAALALKTAAEVAEDAVLIVADGFAVHDPQRVGATFARFSTDTQILRPDGRRLLIDAGEIGGPQLAAQFGALGGMAACATLLVIAPPQRCPDLAGLEAAADRCGCLAGASAAPNQAGVAMRLLAPDGGTLTRGIEAAFHVAAKAALGADLARRRK
ncbi:urease accessory protein UreD [Rhodopseudomonas palustris]|uniref:Urease accessory protein UreD n=1 Tax=Rhodopseudomonas palustris TaxID=1076 RepID=A0A0D7F3H5_RHOPL|nr:urease accessory protein UreD [Rhodopseudomonas palustris]